MFAAPAKFIALRFRRVLGALIVMPWCLPALAESSSAPDLGSSLAQLVFSMVVVIGLLFGSLWLLKRLSAPRGQAAGLLRVIAGTAVGSRERVVIVEIGSTWLVLGVAPGQVTTLAEMPRGSLPEPSCSNDKGPDFASLLTKHRRSQTTPDS